MINSRETIQELFSAREIVSQCNFFAFSLEITPILNLIDPTLAQNYENMYIQVDLIWVTLELFPLTCFFYSYTGMGAILGGMLKHWGFTLGIDGLSFRIGEASLFQIIVTNRFTL